MKKNIALVLALTFYASILPWSAGAVPKAKFSDLVIEGGPLVDVRAYGASTSNTAAQNVTSIQAAVTALTAGKILLIPEVYRINDTIIVNAKTDIKIVGSGGLTFSSGGSTSHIFRLTGACSNIEINGLKLAGDNVTTNDQIAIAIPDTAGNVSSNIRVIGNTISNINVGVGLYAQTNATISDVLVEGNSISNIVGTAPGRGYGVILAGAKNARIVNNKMDTCHRHSIYQSWGDNVAVLIAGNQISNHRSGVATAGFFAAIDVTRSSGVVVANNTIKDYYDGGLEVSHDTSNSVSASNVSFIGNKLINRKNAVAAVLIGEGLTPGSYNTEHVLFLGNTFIDSASVAGYKPYLWILNGIDINIQSNHFMASDITDTFFMVKVGDSGIAPIINATDLNDIFITGNSFTALTAGDNVVAVQIGAEVGRASATSKVYYYNNAYSNTLASNTISFQTAHPSPYIVWDQGGNPSIRPGVYNNNDTTPSVSGGINYLLVANTENTTITNFDDGTEGQVVTMIFLDNNTTLSGVNLYLKAAFNSTSNDTFTILKRGLYWYEVGRSVIK